MINISRLFDSFSRAKPAINLFSFVLAEQLSAAIIPLYSNFLSATETPPMIASLPMIVFVLFGLLGNAVVSRLIDFFGLKNTLISGYLFALLGHLISANSSDVYEFVLARAAAGTGYSIVTLGLQARILSKTDMHLALSTFTSVVMGAVAIGTGVGGFIASLAGYRAVFSLAALVVGLIAVDELFSLPQTLSKSIEKSGSEMRALRDAEFADLLFYVAIPAKIILSGFVYYYTPLYLAGVGKNASYIGFVLILYAIFMIPSVYAGAHLTNSISQRLLISLTALSASFLLLLAPYSLTFVVAGIGICHGIASVPTLARVISISRSSGDSTTNYLALIRSGERIGSVIGPALTACILMVAGFRAVSWVLGFVVLILATHYSVRSYKRAS